MNCIYLIKKSFNTEKLIVSPQSSNISSFLLKWIIEFIKFDFLFPIILNICPLWSTYFWLLFWYVVEMLYRLQARIYSVTNWTKLFATNEVQFTDNAIDNFLAFVDHMSCSADTYVSLGGSNGGADQLTNWDGTQKVGLGAVIRKKPRGLSL